MLSLLACVTPKRLRQSDARTELGTAYLREGSAPDAVLTLREAAKFNPQNAIAWERLGLAYMASGAFEESEVAFKKALRLADQHLGRIHYNYGLLMLKTERYDDAVIQLKTTLSDLTHRTPASTLNSLGFVYHQMERYDEAIAAYTDALNRSPKLCQARFHRAATHQTMGSYAKALDDYEQVIQTCGDEVPGAYFHAAEVLLATEQVAAACAYLKTARDAVADSELSRAASQLMARECGS
jgi:Tfp pilus assembly protein PilF